MAIRITGIDDVAFPEDLAVRVELRVDDSQARSVRTRSRSRSLLPPAHDDTQYESWTRRIQFTRLPGAALTHAEIDEALWGICNPDGRERILKGKHGATDYELACRVRSFERSDEAVEWIATIEALDPYWRGAMTENGDAGTTIEVSGNVVALPVITITDGAEVIRWRVTVTSTRPLASYPIGVAVSGAEAQHVVYHHGRRIPFALSGGVLFFRIDTDLPRGATRHRALIDIYSGASINNQIEAGELEAAGLTLSSAINSGTVVPDPAAAATNPLSPALAWTPARTVRSEALQNVTYGIEGETLRMVDRLDTGRAEQLQDDADAIALVAPLGMTSINGLDLSVLVGYRRGEEAVAQGAGERVMRVTLSTIDGSPVPAGPTWDAAHLSPYPVASVVPALADIGFPVARHRQYLYYATFQFGAISFPNTHSVPLREFVNQSWGDTSARVTEGSTIWRNDYMPWELPELAAQFLGCTVQTGPPGVWYLHFPDDAFGGIDLPLLTMSLHEKGGSFSYFSNDESLTSIDFSVQGDTSLDDVLLFEAVWVDPVTEEPLADGGRSRTGPGPTYEVAGEQIPVAVEPIWGAIRVAVKAWYEDSPYPVVVWSRTLRSAASAAAAPNVSGMTANDDPDGGGVIFTTTTPLNLDLDGAIQVAIGLEPAATEPGEVNWGALEVTGLTSITLAGTPTIGVQQVSAQRLAGTLSNDTTGHSIRFDETFSDATGLEIDTSRQGSHEVIRGVDGFGPVYGAPLPSNGTRWFDLTFGENEVNAAGDLSTATIALEWAPRLAADS